MNRPRTNQATYLGQGIGFPFNIGDEGRLAWSAGPMNIRESIRIILLTEPGERLFLPEFGAGLRSFLFQPNNVSTHRVIRERITRALARWEPRIVLETVTVEPDPEEPQAAVATIRFKLVATRARDKLVLSLKLNG